jgi:hypothetical protein
MRDWVGRTVVDRDGAETGTCRAVLTDDATGLPEWMYAELDGDTVVIPLLDAAEDGDRLRVTASRAQVVDAPRVGGSQKLSAAQEVALYQHYGIEYSTAASETVLPVGAASPDPATAADLESSAPAGGADAPGPAAADDPGPSSGAAAARNGVLAGVWAALAALAALGVVGTAVLRRRAARRLPEPVGRRARLAAGVAAARARRRAGHGAPAIAATATAARQRLDEVASTVGPQVRAASDAARSQAAEFAAAATPVVAAAGRGAQRAATTGAAAAAHAAGTTARLAGATLASGAALGADIGQAGLRAARGVLGAAESVPEAVAESTEHLQKGWRRLMDRLSLGLGLAGGYVLGARAGRGRFEQMQQAAAGLLDRPEVRSAVGRVRAAVPPKLSSTLDGLSRRTPGSGADSGRVIAVDSGGEATAESTPSTTAPPFEPSPDLPGPGR